jgi:hypothetical protein
MFKMYVFVTGALFIPLSLASSVVPYGVPTIKLLVTGEW